MNLPPVKKRAGDVMAATSPETLNPVDDTALVCAAQIQCDHADTRIAIEPPGSVHFGKEICRNCDRVLRWIPKPENVERRRVTAYRVAKMSMLPNLSPWQSKFLSSVIRQKKFSPKQTEVLERLWAELGDRP